MASWQARAARYFIRKRVRPAFGDMRDLMRVRKVMGQAMPPPKGVTYTRDTLGGIPAHVESLQLQTKIMPAGSEWEVIGISHGQWRMLATSLPASGSVTAIAETHSPLMAGTR